MGECGCGDINNVEGVYRMGEYVLVVDKHMGCRYCHTGLMAVFHLFTKEEASAFQFVPEKEFKPDSFGHAEIVVIFEGTEI